MGSNGDEGTVLVTGACGQIGRQVCYILRDTRRSFLPVDLDVDATQHVTACDLTVKNDLARLFQAHPIRAVIHLAGVLPSAFQAEPLAGADSNLSASLALMRQALDARVRRFVFASSMSVYGSSPSRRPLTQNDATTPDEPYGASKLALELIGETLARKTAFEFVSLRIARVVGPGIRRTSSAWRSQIFEFPSDLDSIHVPFSPEAMLSLVHVADVARMLITLTETAAIGSFVYNTPAEIWKAKQLKELIEELRRIPVCLVQGGAHGGPMCDGSRFAREFGFQLRGLRDHLLDRLTSN